MGNRFIPLGELEVYRLARMLSDIGWKIYEELDYRERKTMGDQFITATDSVGANIAEGYARYHFLDRAKFYCNARGSLSESANHWIELLFERRKVSDSAYSSYKSCATECGKKLNNFIKITRKTQGDSF